MKLYATPFDINSQQCRLPLTIQRHQATIKAAESKKPPSQGFGRTRARYLTGKTRWNNKAILFRGFGRTRARYFSSCQT